jgi:hypothetical protein
MVHPWLLLGSLYVDTTSLRTLRLKKVLANARCTRSPSPL